MTSHKSSINTKQRARSKSGASVRFSETEEVVTFHKSPAEEGNELDAATAAAATTTTTTTTTAVATTTTRRKKRPRLDRPNPDEIDDIDGYVPEEEGDVGFAAIPGESQTLEAKRKRRLKQQVEKEEFDDNDGMYSTHIDQETSLASEGIPIEAFNMEEEKTDGTGYFDGDTYIFRRGGGVGVNEEPDAWLDSLREGGDEEVIYTSNGKLDSSQQQLQQEQSSDGGGSNKIDSWSREELYSKLVPLVSDTETVASALIRYGQLIKQQQGGKHSKPTSNHGDLAKQALNDMTEISSALFLKGEVSIYEQTRNDILRLLGGAASASTSAAATSIHSWGSDENDAYSGAGSGSSQPPHEKTHVLWEYEGNSDGQIHGPYTTQQMMGWIQMGYFVGPTAVRIRTVQDKVKNKEQPQVQEQQQSTSIGEDLLSDLMEDDDDDIKKEKGDGEATANSFAVSESSKVRGKWILSDQVNFQQYL
ncbi:hypothetical protein ACA910_017986 [Epithemia clementina (nom. ined.)]